MNNSLLTKPLVGGEILRASNQRLEGVLNHNKLLKSSESIRMTYTITIVQPTNQKITVSCNGIDYTSTFTAYYQDEISCYIEVTSEPYYYRPGTLNITNAIVDKDITISATDRWWQPHVNVYIGQSGNAWGYYNGHFGSISPIQFLDAWYTGYYTSQGIYVNTSLHSGFVYDNLRAPVSYKYIDVYARYEGEEDFLVLDKWNMKFYYDRNDYVVSGINESWKQYFLDHLNKWVEVYFVYYS